MRGYSGFYQSPHLIHHGDIHHTFGGVANRFLEGSKQPQLPARRLEVLHRDNECTRWQASSPREGVARHLRGRRTERSCREFLLKCLCSSVVADHRAPKVTISFTDMKLRFSRHAAKSASAPPKLWPVIQSGRSLIFCPIDRGEKRIPNHRHASKKPRWNLAPTPAAANSVPLCPSGKSNNCWHSSRANPSAHRALPVPPNHERQPQLPVHFHQHTIGCYPH